MFKRALLLVALLIGLSASTRADVWNVDIAHSLMGFTIKHLVITTVHGNFADFVGKIDFDGKDVSTGKAEFTIQAKSINTGNARRDADLRSSNFFAVDSFPTITFKSKQVVKGDGQNFKLVGDLTMRGVTKEVTFNCVFNGVVEAFGETRAAFSAETTVNRQDFRINWSKTMDNGGLIAGNDVAIHLDVEAVKVKS